MRVLRCTWPLAGALFVTLASSDLASADEATPAPDPAMAATAEPADLSFRLFGKTWCLGETPHATPCDFVVPSKPTLDPATPAAAETDRPLDRMFATLRRLFTGTPADHEQADSGG